MSRQVKVGIFVIAGLALVMLAVFLIGTTKQLWEPKVDYQTAFEDVAGLKPGAPVRMGGVDIGQVTGVDHAKDPKDTRIYVRLSIEKREAPHIHTDSVASVANKGLLGDRMIEISSGTPDAPLLQPGSVLPT